jgi:hypothetical protein
MFVVAAAVFAPLAIYFLQNPGTFTQRAGSRTAWRRAVDSDLARAVANVLQFFVPGRGIPYSSTTCLDERFSIP